MRGRDKKYVMIQPIKPIPNKRAKNITNEIGAVWLNPAKNIVATNPIAPNKVNKMNVAQRDLNTLNL